MARKKKIKRRPGSNPGGRPITLTETRIKELKTCIEEGNYVTTCLDCLAIPHSTYYNWKRRAEEPDAPNIYLKLVEAIKKARGRAVRGYVNLIKKAADEGNWQAAAWYLERTNPSFWGRVNRVEMEAKQEIKVEKTDDNLKTILEDPELSQIATELTTKLGRKSKTD